MTSAIGIALALLQGVATLPGSRSVAIPFMESRNLQLAGPWVAGYFTSSIDETSLLVIRSETGAIRQRLDRAERTVSVVSARAGGTLYSFSPVEGAVKRIDLSEGSLRTFPLALEARSGKFCASQSTVALLLEQTQTTPARVIFFESGGERREPFSVILPQRASADDPICGSSGVLVASRDSPSLFVSPSKSVALRILPDGLTAVGVWGDLVVAVNAAHTELEVISDTAKGAVRRLVYATAPAARISPSTLRVFEDGRTAFLEIAGNSSFLVSLSLVTAAEPPQRVLSPVAPGQRAVVDWDGVLFAAAVVSGEGRLELSQWNFAPATIKQSPQLVRQEGTSARNAFSSLKEDGLSWLLGKLSASFQTRQGLPGRLIDSYDDDRRTGWTYDAALASIALVAKGRPDESRLLLAGLWHMQNEDGSFSFSFDPDTKAPSGPDTYAGTAAWVAMAANFYELDTKDRGFAPMARAALVFLETLREKDPASIAAGAVSMSPSRRAAFSTEHNADSFSAFYWRSRLENREDLASVAEQIKSYLLRKAWHANEGAGHFRVGLDDPTLYLDAQTWVCLALGENGDTGLLREAVQTAAMRLASTRGTVNGVQEIAGFNEHEGAGDKVWSEGTEGMVSAMFALGMESEGARYHAQTARYQADHGGIPYATENADGWTTAPSVAGTAWFVINSARRNPFRPAVRRVGALAK